MERYKTFSATVIIDTEIKPENIPDVRCPKCGARMVPIRVDTNMGIYPTKYSRFPDGKQMQKIVTSTMWECEFICGEKTLYEKVLEG